MVKLLERLRLVYAYIKEKRLLTYMQVKPSQFLVEKHVVGLGFRLKNSGGKRCIIILEPTKHDLE